VADDHHSTFDKGSLLVTIKMPKVVWLRSEVEVAIFAGRDPA
jgi:hypothetical protein